MTSAGETDALEDLAALELLQTAAQLDEHHAPETNGRMAICRRCGMQTVGPTGGHAPRAPQLAQAKRWLAGQSITQRIAALKRARDT